MEKDVSSFLVPDVVELMLSLTANDEYVVMLKRRKNRVILYAFKTQEEFARSLIRT